MTPVEQNRAELVDTLFPGGLPRLWCPLLTHYTSGGSTAGNGIDRGRIAAHIAHMRPWVPAFLAPGSTGDGWEMDEQEADALLEFLAGQAEEQDFSLMVGVLRTNPGTVVPAIRSVLDRFTEGRTDAASFARRHLCGFTVTPPKGAGLPQEKILSELEAIAATGAPIAIYQLPQITENEMSAETVRTLASAFPNVYLMKDTSGADRVALSETRLGNLVLVRGAEGEYAQWLKAGGGHYDGFLLSTANSFARELATIISLIQEGNREQADALSRRVSLAVSTVFAAAQELPFGNAFANANKAFDHHFAWGPTAMEHEPPMTHSGERLPQPLVERALAALEEAEIDPAPGYML